MTESPVFVGRTNEIQRMEAAMRLAMAGTGRVVTVSGEAGIGKTTIIRRLIDQHGIESGQVRWGRCRQDVGAPAYWPWVQVLRSLVRDGGNTEHLLEDLDEESAPYMAQLISDVRRSICHCLVK
jgi:predicted ATPase